MVLVVKDPSASAGDARNMGSIPGGRSPKEEMATLSSILAGEFHGQRSLAGYSPWGHRELDTTGRLSTQEKNPRTLSRYVSSFPECSTCDSALIWFLL